MFVVIFREEFVDAIDGECGDVLDDMKEVFLWVDVVRFSGSEE